jgi:DNA-binding MarR family transcriptional regulator
MTSPLREYFDILILHEKELWSRVERRTSAEGTVSLARFEILTAISTTPACRIQDVADQLKISVGATSRLTDRVEADGLVTRSPHPRDGRSSQVELTDLGRVALNRTGPAIDEALNELLGKMDEHELAVLTAFLKRAHQILNASSMPGAETRARHTDQGTLGSPAR